MGQQSEAVKEPAEQVIKEIRRATRRQFSAEEKIRIVLSGLRGEEPGTAQFQTASTQMFADDVDATQALPRTTAPARGSPPAAGRTPGRAPPPRRRRAPRG